MMRRMMASENKDEHFQNEELFKKFGMPTISETITHKRLSWIAHALRRSPADRSHKAVTAALLNRDSIWTRLVMRDCEKTNINFNDLGRESSARRSFRMKNKMTNDKKTSTTR